MRTDEGVRLRGYDGFSRALRESPFVPEGPAVWEMGTDQDPERKANSDYAKRTADPLEHEPAETTFVFVTPRSWPGKKDWAQERRAEGVWADVVVRDVDDIDLAFENAPAAHLWISELVGLPAEGVRSLEDWWSRFSLLSSPPLTPAMVLAGRADQAAELLRIYSGEARVTIVRAPSVDDLLAFVAAVILSAAEDERMQLLSRTIVVRDAGSLRRLEHTRDLLVLIPFQDDLSRDASLVRKHHVVIRSDDGGGSTIDLPPVDPTEFSRHLVELGVDSDRAGELARLARRSVQAFQRSAPVWGSVGAPEWASRLGSRVSRRAWLSGRWNERRSGDIDALEGLLRTPYSDVVEELRSFATGPDPMFVVVGDTWAVASLTDAWQFGHQHLQTPDLIAFEEMIQGVLASVDPRLELPVADRWMAGIYGKTPVHSGDLRHGVAEVLALLGARGTDVTIGAGTLQSWLHGVVYRLFVRLNDDVTGRLWASLTDVLPLLAESAPDVFLDAVQSGLEGDKPLIGLMFADSEHQSAFSISSPHTGLLWALESTAWSAEHFGQAVEQLARLTEVDPGGRLSNRPSASLAAVFRPWLPQTSASAGRRMAAIDALRQRHSTVAWSLLLATLPENHAVGFYSHSPKYRGWKSESQPLTRAELLSVYEAVADRLVSDAEADPDRWTELVTRLDDFPPTAFDRAVRVLRSLVSDASHANLRATVWEPLRALVDRHQRYAHTKWAMSQERVDVLDELRTELSPADPADRVRWLFDEHLPDLPEQVGEEFVADDYIEAVATRRREAVRSVFDTDEVDGVVRLIRAAKEPWAVGVAAGEADIAAVGRVLLDALGDESGPLLSAAQAWAVQQSRAHTWEWTQNVYESLPERPLARARLLLASDQLNKAWNLAAHDARVDSAYWAEFSPYGRGQGFELAEEAARQLMAHDRPRAALMLMNLYAGSVPLDPELVAEALEHLLSIPPDHPDPFRVDGNEIERLLDYVRQHAPEDQRLLALEWRLRPTLRFDAHSPALERQLARDPAFFVEVLSLCFRRSDSDADDSSSVDPQVATNAYQLLDDWSVVPGTEASGVAVDAAALNAWVDEALPLLRAAGREEIGLDILGRVLAKAPGDPDGSWPTVAVRDLIESTASSELDNGFRVEVFNSRGPTSRGLMEGGEQERALATKYGELAQKIADAWPRTAAILRSLAVGYQREAERNDLDVQRFVEGLER